MYLPDLQHVANSLRMTQKWLNTCRIVAVAAAVVVAVAAADIAAADIAAVIDAICLWLLRGRLLYEMRS